MKTKFIEKNQESYIENFKYLFGSKGIISEELLELQKKYLGFTIFILHKKNISDAIKIGIQNSRNIIEKQKSVFQIPHTYIFGGLFLGFILSGINATFLFLPIVILLISISAIKVFKTISEKINLLKRTRVFFNISLEEAKKINNDFLYIKDFYIRPQTWRSKTGKTYDGNKIGFKIFLFLFSQPFIFLHLHFFALVPYSVLFIYDFIIFIILFGFFEKIILFTSNIYYKIYFFLIDKFPSIFGKENKKYDFFYDLYELANNLIKKLELFNQNIDLLKSGTINNNLGKGLSDTILYIGKLVNLISKNKNLINENKEFKIFLKNLVNEILDKYIDSFNYLEEKINKIKNENINNHSSKELKFIKIITEENLTQKIDQIKIMKSKLNNMKI